MAQSAVFGNRIIKLPGVYARVVSGVETEIPLSTYSNVLLIDAGAGKGFNSAKGIVGYGRECIYSLSQDQANFYIKGGPLVPVLEKLWNPAVGAEGIGVLNMIKAATSQPATIQGEISMFGGAITMSSVTTVEEGKICNTVKSEGDNPELKTGYILRSVWDSKLNKGYVEIIQGTYEGVNLGGFVIGQTEENSHPKTIFRSKKCSTPKELATSLSNSLDFKALVIAKDIAYSGDGNTWTTKENNEFEFEGGDDQYAISLVDILPASTDVDYSVVLVCTDEENGTTTKQQTMIEEVKAYFEDADKFIRQAVAYEEDKSLAITQAQFYDSERVIVTSGICKKTSRNSPTGFITQDNMVTAAVCLGRIFGLSPEIAGTMKTLNIDGMEVEPTSTDLEDMLDNGVISPYYDSDFGSYCLSQVCNSLQANTQLINPDCTTYSVQVMRILGQVIKNLQQQAKLDFWGGNKGVNKGTLSDAYVKEWTQTLLDKLTVAPNKTENNYLLGYEVTKVETVDDTKRVYLAVTVNGEITKIFFLVTVLG